MSKVQLLRGFINQRLTAAAEEIFGLFERTISEYEEELCRSKEENQRHRKLLDAFQPEVRLRRADIQQLLVSKEEVPPEQLQQCSPKPDQEDPPEPPHITETDGEDSGGPKPGRNFNSDSPLEPATHDQTSLSSDCENNDSCDWEENWEEHLQKHQATQTLVKAFNCSVVVSKAEVPPELQQQQWSPRLDQEDPPETPHVKEDQEKLGGKQLPGLEEAEIPKFPFTPVPVKSEEDDEEKPLSSQLHQSQTEESRDAENLKMEADGEDCGGPEPARNFNPDSPLQPDTHDQTSLSSGPPETDNGYDWVKTWEPQPGLNQNNEAPVSDQECNTGETSVSSSECAARFGHKEHLQNHSGTQTGGKPFSCSVCGKSYSWKSSLKTHMRLHSGENVFSCSFCEKTFPLRINVVTHMRVHTGEKPFSCSVCGKGFALKGTLTLHSRIHTGERPFSCSVCGKTFTERGTMRRHSRVHTGEKPFSCTICGKRFTRKGLLRQHSILHSGETN